MNYLFFQIRTIQGYSKTVLLLNLLILMALSPFRLHSQDEDAFMIKKIFSEALSNGQCFANLAILSEEIGGRLAGSPQAAAAVEFTFQELEKLDMDTVYKQACMVPHWVRGEREVVRIVNSSQVGSMDLHALALGNSVGTGPQGILAEVVEVAGLDDLEELGKEKIKGKIVFFNRPMDPTQLRTFNAYGGAVDQRAWGASRASKYGALGVLVRSITTSIDHIPHTGASVYEEGVHKIPGIAISTKDADLLSSLLKHSHVNIFMRSTSHMLNDKISHNVIGEIKGSKYPDEIILVGGHLDSWDVGGGAHDDGAGCMHSIEVIRILKAIGYTPKRTIRCVMFMNEENGLAGGKEYWRVSNENKEYHMAAIESDAGGFSPRGFSCDADESVFEDKFRKLTGWLPILEPYGLTIVKGGSGADISGLKGQKGMLFGLRPDSARYFDFHHTEADVIDAVHKRELELGAAAITSLVYLLDQHGL